MVPYRPTARTEARRRDVRRRIVSAAVALIARGGYQATTMAAVAAEAHVGVGSVYRQFPSKPELFQEAYRVASRRELDVISSAAGADLPAVDRLALAIRTSARRALAGQVLGRALLVEPTDPMVEAERLRFRRAYRDVLAALIDDGISHSELPAQDAAISATALMGAIVEVLFGPISPIDPGSDTTESVVDALVGFCRTSLYFSGSSMTDA